MLKPTEILKDKITTGFHLFVLINKVLKKNGIQKETVTFTFSF